MGERAREGERGDTSDAEGRHTQRGEQERERERARGEKRRGRGETQATQRGEQERERGAGAGGEAGERGWNQRRQKRLRGERERKRERGEAGERGQRAACNTQPATRSLQRAAFCFLPFSSRPLPLGFLQLAFRPLLFAFCSPLFILRFALFALRAFLSPLVFLPFALRPSSFAFFLFGSAPLASCQSFLA